MVEQVETFGTWERIRMDDFSTGVALFPESSVSILSCSSSNINNSGDENSEFNEVHGFLSSGGGSDPQPGVFILPIMSTLY